MTQAQWQYRWRNHSRLKEIIEKWAALPRREQSTDTLELATDAAHLSRHFVAEKCNSTLQLRGFRAIEVKPGAARPAGESNADAGEE